jgi:hypothetical protein
MFMNINNFVKITKQTTKFYLPVTKEDCLTPESSLTLIRLAF